MSVWYLLPFAAVVALGVPIYNNFRHLLFITPALFVVAATGWDWLLGRVETLAGRILLSVLLLAPGAAAIVRLHPYEYVYFNELVGGVQGAYGEYLLDSWCTAYREAAQAVNRMAREGAVVIVWGPRTTAEPFLRQDLRLASVPVPGHEADLGASLAMGCSWATIDPKFFPGEPIVWAIERDGVPLAIVKRIRSEAGDH
jgi:hypothetical protein